MAEHSTVNRRVAGSSPAWGAIKEMCQVTSPLFYVCLISGQLQFYLFIKSFSSSDFLIFDFP